MEHSTLKKVQSRIVTVSKDNVDIRPAKGIRYLFTTKTCPNCQIAKEALADLKYKLIDAEENPELVRKYGIMQAPTLVIVNENQVKKYVNASNIRKYAEEQKEKTAREAVTV